MTISPILPSAVSGLQQVTPSTTTKPVSGSVEQVGQTFEQLLSGLNDSQTQSDNLVSQLALGGDVDLHQVMIGLEENDVNFRVALAIRDKLVDAYHEVMRMQI